MGSTAVSTNTACNQKCTLSLRVASRCSWHFISESERDFLEFIFIFISKSSHIPDFIDSEKKKIVMSYRASVHMSRDDFFFLPQNGKTDISGLGGCSSCYLIIYHRQNNLEELMQHQVL